MFDKLELTQKELMELFLDACWKGYAAEINHAEVMVRGLELTDERISRIEKTSTGDLSICVAQSTAFKPIKVSPQKAFIENIKIETLRGPQKGALLTFNANEPDETKVLIASRDELSKKIQEVHQGAMDVSEEKNRVLFKNNFGIDIGQPK